MEFNNYYLEEELSYYIQDREEIELDDIEYPSIEIDYDP